MATTTEFNKRLAIENNKSQEITNFGAWRLEGYTKIKHPDCTDDRGRSVALWIRVAYSPVKKYKSPWIELVKMKDQQSLEAFYAGRFGYDSGAVTDRVIYSPEMLDQCSQVWGLPVDDIFPLLEKLLAPALVKLKNDLPDRKNGGYMATLQHGKLKVTKCSNQLEAKPDRRKMGKVIEIKSKVTKPVLIPDTDRRNTASLNEVKLHKAKIAPTELTKTSGRVHIPSPDIR